ncbi:uncharacterized protein CBL_07940 [Carabus blaptoides fortunei]
MTISCNLRVEVPILAIFFCFMLAEYIIANFTLYRVCYVTLGYNVTDCALLGSNNASEEIKKLEENVQPYASTILMARSVIEAVVPVFCSFIVGPWSDKHGRKPVLITCFIGYFFAFVCLVVVSLLPNISPWWLLTSPICASLGGGICAMLTVTFCYIVDTTSEENRGIRMGILESCFSVGSIAGTLLSSYVLAACGYVGVFSICTGFSVFAILYTCCFVPESVNVLNSEHTKYKDLLDISVIRKTIKTCLKQRPNKDRTILGLLMTILILYIFVIFSDSSVFFLFVREKFQWSLSKYTTFSAVNSFVDVLVTLLMLFVVHKYLRISDMIIILIGFISLSVSSVMFGLANNDWIIYIGSGVKRLSCTIAPLGRSAISKLLPPEDLGHVFAVTTSLETIVQLVSSPMYTLLYNNTLNIAPSAFNFLSAAIYGLNVIVTSAVIVLKKLNPSPDLRLINAE